MRKKITASDIRASKKVLERVVNGVKRRRKAAALMRRIFLILFLLSLAAAAIVLLQVPFLRVCDDGMAPLVLSGEVLALNDKVALQRGELVGARLPEGGIVRRVAALPGDWVDLRRESIYVNGEPLASASGAAIRLPDGLELPYQVAAGSVLLLSDAGDADAAELSGVAEAQLAGKVIFRVWPFRKSGFIYE